MKALPFMPSTTLPEIPLAGKGPLDLNRLLVKRPAATFFMRADRDSSKYGLLKGDILVVDRSLDPGKNSLVVIAGATLKLCYWKDVASGVEVTLWGVVAYVIQKRL